MKTNKRFLAVLGLTIFLISLAGVVNRVQWNTDQELRDTATVLRVEVKQTNERLNLFTMRAAQDSVTIAILQEDLRLLEGKADNAATSTSEAVALRDSTRATFREDTLPASFRNLLDVERAVAESRLRELNIAGAHIVKLDSIVRIETTRANVATSLLWTVQAERDEALSIIRSYEKRLEFSLSRLLFRDLPRKVACAGGGAAVAAMNKGDVLVGAGVGLIACLLMESIIK